MKICIIIDGFSTAAHYVSRFNSLGYICLHIQSSKALPGWITSQLEKDKFRDILIHEDNKATQAWIEQFGIPDIVLHGLDTGAKLADFLAFTFKLPTANDYATVLSRRDKYYMTETIREKGLRAIKQIRATSCDDALAWIAKTEGVDFPIIVKPLESGSSEGFYVCNSEADLRRAFVKEIKKDNFFGIFNEALLVQEYIRGIEYVVNTVGRDDNHFVTELCEYVKYITPEGSSLYRAVKFLPLDDKLAPALKKYSFEVLKALGIKHGPTHIEIIIDKDGPILVEIACRPAGKSFIPRILQAAHGHNQLDLSVLCYADPADFFSKAMSLVPAPKKHLISVLVASVQEGIVAKINIELLLKLKSFLEVVTSLKPGDVVPKAQNLNDTIMNVYLLHDDWQVLQSDLETITCYEQQGLLVSLASKDAAESVSFAI